MAEDKKYIDYIVDDREEVRWFYDVEAIHPSEFNAVVSYMIDLVLADTPA